MNPKISFEDLIFITVLMQGMESSGLNVAPLRAMMIPFLLDQWAQEQGEDTVTMETVLNTRVLELAVGKIEAMVACLNDDPLAQVIMQVYVVAAEVLIDNAKNAPLSPMDEFLQSLGDDE